MNIWEVAGLTGITYKKQANTSSTGGNDMAGYVDVVRESFNANVPF